MRVGCEQSSSSTMTCAVSFLFKAAFYDYDSSELTGQGAAIVELGGLEGGSKEASIDQVVDRTASVERWSSCDDLSSQAEAVQGGAVGTLGRQAFIWR